LNKEEKIGALENSRRCPSLDGAAAASAGNDAGVQA
jgi:hypothetical protein